MAQGSAGEVIKENGSLRGGKKSPAMDFIFYWKQVTQGHTHSMRNLNPHGHAKATTHTQNKEQCERSSSLLAATSSVMKSALAVGQGSIW